MSPCIFFKICQLFNSNKKFINFKFKTWHSPEICVNFFSLFRIFAQTQMIEFNCNWIKLNLLNFQGKYWIRNYARDSKSLIPLIGNGHWKLEAKFYFKDTPVSIVYFYFRINWIVSLHRIWKCNKNIPLWFSYWFIIIAKAKQQKSSSTESFIKVNPWLKLKPFTF